MRKINVIIDQYLAIRSRANLAALLLAIPHRQINSEGTSVSVSVIERGWPGCMWAACR